MLGDLSKVKISLCMCVYNTSHLLKRSIETYYNQTMPKDSYELIIVNDNSDDDVWAVVEPWMDKMNIRYFHIRHHDGMRGGMIPFSLAYKWSEAEILAEVTPETMIHPNVIQMMYDLHEGKQKRFVTFKTWNLTKELQLIIDTVDWRENLDNIQTLPDFRNNWTIANEQKTAFRTHQTSSYRRKDFFELWGEHGYWRYNDYGSCDPKFSNLRETNGWEDYVVMSPMVYHQWHPPFQWAMAHGKAKWFNKHAHTILNYSGDPRIPKNGTREIWDGNDDSPLSPEQIAEWRALDDIVYATGYVRLD